MMGVTKMRASCYLIKKSVRQRCRQKFDNDNEQRERERQRKKGRQRPREMRRPDTKSHHTAHPRFQCTLSWPDERNSLTKLETQAS